MQTPTPQAGGPRHTPATLSIQRRLERWELQHLRELAAEQAAQIDELQRQLSQAEHAADYWAHAHHELAEHLADGTADARAIGLTTDGNLLVVATGAAA